MKGQRLFKVTTREISAQSYQVEAKTKEEAIEKVREGEGEIINNTQEYVETLSPDTWQVEPLEIIATGNRRKA